MKIIDNLDGYVLELNVFTHYSNNISFHKIIFSTRGSASSSIQSFIEVGITMITGLV